MANREVRDGAFLHGGDHVLGKRCFLPYVRLAVLSGALCVGALPAAHAGESRAAKVVSRQVKLEGAGNTKPILCQVVPVLDSSGEPRAYFMDVKSIISGKTDRETVTVRLHFDVLGNYERYELPPGGNLTKSGGKPFTQADHEKLHQILSDPYSQLKSIGLNEITAPGSTGPSGGKVDAVSRPTALSRGNTVVGGAAYTCCTLWHWSHGEVVNVIRDMTIRASDKQDLLRYLRSDKDAYVAFALEQLRTQNLFDPETIAAVVQVMRHGSAKVIDSVLDYLVKASSETGADHFFSCCDDEYLVADSIKRTRFLEAIRDSGQKLPSGYLDRFGGWLTRADSYYEVHLLLTLRERENATSEEGIEEAFSLLDSDNALVVRRCRQHLKAVKLSDAQQKKLEAFERQHPE